MTGARWPPDCLHLQDDMTVGIVRMLWPILRMQANCLHAFLADATALQVGNPE